MIKNQLLDRFSRIGRLRQRLDEILSEVEERTLPRMEGGDLIGQQIVAAVEALGQRSDEENRLLVDAHRERARLFYESSGATILESAEALIAAHEVLQELPEHEPELRSLAALAKSVLGTLLEVGSRRTAWSCLEIVMAEMELAAAPSGHEELLDQYVDVTCGLIKDGRDDGVLVAVMRHCEWARSRAPHCFRRLADLLPVILEEGCLTMSTGALLRAYLYARGLSVRVDAPILEGIAGRLASKERIDAEARAVYHDLLANEPDRRAALESLFRELSYVNPSVDLKYDADCDSLNVLLAEYYADSEWVWRNRALLVRRRGDALGALAHLARAMSISGEPPEIMGMLAPILAGLGFVQSAHQFSRFASTATKERFHLDVLKLIDTHPSTEIGKIRLQRRLHQLEGRPELPPEFKALIRSREAELLYEADSFDEAFELYTAIFRDDLTNEIAAVRLANIAYRKGDRRRTENYIAARFSARVNPFVFELKSRIAEDDGDYAKAAAFNDQALEALPKAQEAGRGEKTRTLSLLADRIRTIHGEQHAQCALLAMLEIETHAPPHADLISLQSRLEQRHFELDARGGDAAASSAAVVELASRDLADTAVFIASISKSVAEGDYDRALELIGLAESEGHSSSSEVALLEARICAKTGDLSAARRALASERCDQLSANVIHLQAAVELAEGNEAAALQILDRLSQKGEKEELRRAYHLRGVLLERLGETDRAYESYLSALAHAAGWNESRRRAGLLALDEAFNSEGAVSDRFLAYKGLDLLDGFHDSESVLRSAIARARLEEDPQEALAELESAQRRLSGAALDCVRRELLARLVASGQTDAAADVADLLLESSDCPDREKLAGMRAAALRHRALARLSQVTGRDPRAERAAFDALKEASELDQDPQSQLLDAILKFALGEGHEEPELGRSPDPSLAVAVALAGGQRRKDGRVRDAVRRAIKDCDGEVALAARLVESMATGKAAEVLAVVEEVDQAALSLPWGRIDILRVIAAKALGENDRRTLESMLARAPGRFAEIGLYRELLVAAEGDCSRLVAMIEELRRMLGDRLRLPDESLKALRCRITELRETPSDSWASARLRVAGKRSRVHDRSALEYWENRVEDDESGVALHHVALMELARAHEAEADQRSDFDLWRRVHKLWSQLLVHDRFWLDLVWSNEEAAALAVSHVREQLGGWILLAQLRLAKRRLFAGDLARAVEHARLVMASPLMRHCDQLRVREALFESLSGDLERLLHKKRYSEAMAAIDHVIVADRDNPCARREMVRVAGIAMAPSLALVDALASPVDPDMVAETCDLLGRTLVVAERSIMELAKGEFEDPTLAESLVVGLRSVAYVARHRDEDVSRASEALQRAVEVADRVGLSSASLRRLHSEMGLEVVRRTIAETPTRAHEIVDEADESPFARALEEVDRLLDIDPENVRVIAQKAKLLLAADRDEEAEKLARELFVRAQQSREAGSVRCAVELLHQVQSEREKLRYESRSEMVAKLESQRNWRAALDIFREMVVGRENEAAHVLKHVDLLLGLRRLDKAEMTLAQLSDCGGMGDAWRLRQARLEMLRAIAARGGDLLSAFELVERQNFKRALVIAKELVTTDDRDAIHQYLVAACHHGLGETPEADAALKSARKHARGQDWMKVMIDDFGAAL